MTTAPTTPVRIPLGQHFVLVVGLFAIGLALRLPYFYPATINWDESSFILVAQAWLDGSLPYTRLWELKPPLAFAFFAGAIEIFGKTIPAIRFAGLIWITLAAYLTFWMGVLLTRDRRVGFVAAGLGVVALALIPSGLAVMTEHVALPALLAAAVLLLARQNTITICLAAGALIAIAAMVRLNLAYVAVFVGFYVLFVPSWRPIGAALVRGSAFAISGLGVVALTALPYALSGQLQTWWDAVFMAPLMYTSTGNPLINAGKQVLQMGGIFFGGGRNFIPELAVLGLVLWAASLPGVWIAITRRKDRNPRERHQLALMLTMTAATGLSVALSRSSSGHYLLQLAPFSAVFAAIFLVHLGTLRRGRLSQAVAAGALFIASVVWVAPGYGTFIGNLVNNRPLSHGPAYEIAEALRRHKVDGRPVYMMSSTIAYWFLGLEPLSRASTHPSNIAKANLVPLIEGPGATPAGEMQRVLDRKPAFIVKPPSKWYMRRPDGKPAQALLDRALERDYTLKTIAAGRMRIYQRKSANSQAPSSQAPSSQAPSSQPQ